VDDDRVTQSAPRIAWVLVQAIPTLDEPDLPIAELWRRLCRHAAQLGLPPPSYQQTRVLVHRSRRIGAMPGIGGLALDVVFRTRGPAEALAVATERLERKRAEQAQLMRELSWRPSTRRVPTERPRPSPPHDG